MSSPYEILDDKFFTLIGKSAELRKLASGCIWSEGPAWLPEDGGHVLWSDVRSNRMWRWSESGGQSVFREPSNHSNGNTRDREGRLVTCEHSKNRVSRTEPDGTVVTLVDRYQSKRLNSPNDVVVKSDGTIWFTDPPYGIDSNREGHQRASEIGANYVYRFDPASGDLRVVADDFDRPNGLAFSPDESAIYISDTGAPKHMRALDVGPDASLANSRVFAAVDPPASDGLRVDTEGNVWTSAGDGIHVFTPDGHLLGKILVPERVANCCFGGPEARTLFITASTSLYAIDVQAQGARWP